MMTTVHTLLCAILLFTGWCRIVKTTERQTRPTIRLSMVSAAVASLVLGVAPWGNDLWKWFPLYEPHIVVIVLLGAFCAVQISTATHWRFSPPQSFQKRHPS